MSGHNDNKMHHTQIVAQWITSLAISVICCAVLFVVFAGYIVELQASNNLLTVKLEHLEERQRMLGDELLHVKRLPQVAIVQPSSPVQGVNTAPTAAVEPVAQPQQGTLAVPAAQNTVQPTAPASAQVVVPVVSPPSLKTSVPKLVAPETFLQKEDGISVPETSGQIDATASGVETPLAEPDKVVPVPNTPAVKKTKNGSK